MYLIKTVRRHIDTWFYEQCVYQLVLANETGALANHALQGISQRQVAVCTTVDEYAISRRTGYLESLCDEASNIRRRSARTLGLSLHMASTYNRTTLASDPAMVRFYGKLLRDLRARHLEP